ncbi:MAG: hypothetical protein ACPGGK_12940 [Pikeienuella sp.]
MNGAAMLDPARGVIVGYAFNDEPRPAQLEFLLNGKVAHKIVVAAPVSVLRPNNIDALGAPPTAICAFEAKLPFGILHDEGRDIQLEIVASDGTSLYDAKFNTPQALAPFVEGSEMADGLTLDIARLRGGVFQGTLIVHNHGTPPEIQLRVKGTVYSTAELSGEGGKYKFTAALPIEVLDDGVNVVEFVLPNEEVLRRFPVSAGVALAGDLAAEVASLRAELDQLKQAFRGALAGGVIRRDERPMIIAETLTQVDHILEMRDRADRFERVEFDDPEEMDEPDWDIET